MGLPAMPALRCAVLNSYAFAWLGILPCQVRFFLCGRVMSLIEPRLLRDVGHIIRPCTMQELFLP